MIRTMLLLFLGSLLTASAQLPTNRDDDDHRRPTASTGLEREDNRWAVAIGPVFGPGIDVAIGSRLRLDVRSWLLLRSSAELSWYVLEANATPFVGLGAGYHVGLYTGERSGNTLSWTQLHAGGELALGRWLLQASAGYMLTRNCDGTCDDLLVGRLVGDLTVGLRLF